MLRLVNLCELYITFEIDRKCCEQIEKSEIDVVGLLLGAQVGVVSPFSFHLGVFSFVAIGLHLTPFHTGH